MDLELTRFEPFKTIKRDKNVKAQKRYQAILDEFDKFDENIESRIQRQNPNYLNFKDIPEIFFSIVKKYNGLDGTLGFLTKKDDWGNDKQGR